MSSILDVARVAKVAPSTVSLVMNHRGRVSPATRQRVTAAIRRLGYRGRGHRLPRNPQTDRTLRFGFVYTPDTLVDGAESAYCREVIRGIEQSLSDSAATLNIMRGQTQVRRDQMFLQQLQAREFNGLIIMGAMPDDGYVQRVLDAGVPMVLLNRPSPQGRYSTVSVDYFAGGVQATEHLLELGHQRVGLMLQTDCQLWPSSLLHQAAVHTLALRGLTPTLDLVLPSPHTAADVLALAQQAVAAGVTAIQTGDALAILLVGALEKLGVRVPDDISVMGFDDRGRPSDSGLQISTITYNKRRLGRMAGRILRRLGQPNRRVAWLAGAVRTRLKPGQTTAHPPERTCA